MTITSPVLRGHPPHFRPRLAFLLGGALALSIACSNNDKSGANEPEPTGPFRSVEAVANAPGSFTQPRAGVPLENGAVAFIATLEDRTEEENSDAGERVGILLQPAKGAVSVLYAGDQLVNPTDLDVSLDGKTLYIADSAAGAESEGALLTLPVAGGEPSVALLGQRPRGVTVGSDGEVYFSGVSGDSGEPGVFKLAGDSANPLFVGAPLVDPSGIAIRNNGDVLVADTRLLDGASENTETPTNSEAGIVLIHGGAASVFATGFATGYPAGIALTLDEKTLIVSGEGPDHSDSVYLVDIGNPHATPGVVTDSFSAYQDAAAGLKRAHDSNTFIWASLAANGGTIYRIQGH
jgi:sugar lactone lactonase YvrE